MPRSSVNCAASIRKVRIDSACETSVLAATTARRISSSRSESWTSSAGGSCGLPRIVSQCVTASGSRVTSAATNGRLLPTATHCATRGCARTRSSSATGDTLLPPLVTRISFLRPVMVR